MATFPLTFDATAPSVDLSSEVGVVVAKNIEWDAAVPAVSLSSNAVITYAAFDVPPFVQLSDSGLLGAIDMVPGPGDTVVVAGRESRELVFILHSDLRYLQTVGRFELSGRPVALASTRLMPNGSINGEGYLFVVVEESLNTPRKLLVLSMDANPEVLAERELPQDSDPNFIWASNRAEDSADFIVVTGGRGAVEVLSADPALEVLCYHESGLALPQVVECFRRTDLERSREGFSEQVWHIVLFSKTGARAMCLEYRDLTSARNIRIPAPGIAFEASVPSVGLTSEMLVVDTLNISADMPVPEVTLVSEVYISQIVDITADAVVPDVSLDSYVENGSLFVVEADVSVPEVELTCTIDIT